MCTMHHPACHLQSVESGPNADQVHCSNQRTQFVICAILWSLQHFNHDLCNIVIIICAIFCFWFLHCCDLYKIVNVICGPIVDCALWGNQCWSSWGQGLLLLFRTPFLHTPLLHTRHMNVIHAYIQEIQIWYRALPITNIYIKTSFCKVCCYCFTHYSNTHLHARYINTNTPLQAGYSSTPKVHKCTSFYEISALNPVFAAIVKATLPPHPKGKPYNKDV